MDDIQMVVSKEWWRVGESVLTASDQAADEIASLPARSDAARAVEQHGLRFTQALLTPKTGQNRGGGVLERVLETGGKEFVSGHPFSPVEGAS